MTRPQLDQQATHDPCDDVEVRERTVLRYRVVHVITGLPEMDDVKVHALFDAMKLAGLVDAVPA